MALFNHATKEVTAKLVYYGPGLCGKTTNLQWIHEKLNFKSKGKLVSLATQTDRTLFFDFLPVELGTIRGMRTRMQIYTVPGQVFYEATRRMVLKGCDAVVFVADSQAAMLDANFESLQSLRRNLLANEIDPGVPMVIQYNKRDLPTALPISVLNARLNPRNLPSFEAVAFKGTGVEETLKGVTKLLFKSLSDFYGAAVSPPSDAASASTTASSAAPTAAVKIQIPDPGQATPAPRPTSPVSSRSGPVGRDSSPPPAVPKRPPTQPPTAAPRPPTAPGPASPAPVRPAAPTPASPKAAPPAARTSKPAARPAEAAPTPPTPTTVPPPAAPPRAVERTPEPTVAPAAPSTPPVARAPRAEVAARPVAAPAAPLVPEEEGTATGAKPTTPSRPEPPPAPTPRAATPAPPAPKGADEEIDVEIEPEGPPSTIIIRASQPAPTAPTPPAPPPPPQPAAPADEPIGIAPEPEEPPSTIIIRASQPAPAAPAPPAPPPPPQQAAPADEPIGIEPEPEEPPSTILIRTSQPAPAAPAPPAAPPPPQPATPTAPVAAPPPASAEPRRGEGAPGAPAVFREPAPAAPTEPPPRGDGLRSDQWLYLLEGMQRGPIDVEDLVDLVLTSIPEDTKVWHPGLEGWVRANQAREIAQEIPPPLPVPGAARGAYADEDMPDFNTVPPQFRTALIADEDEAFRKYLAMPLAAQGFTIHEAADGSAAWQLAVQNRPWLILADVSMPEVDGFEFCRRVRSHPLLSHTPVLFISGSDKYKERYRALQIGADDFLSKQMPIRELLMRIQLLLTKYSDLGEQNEPGVAEEAAGAFQGRIEVFGAPALLQMCAQGGLSGILTALAEDEANTAAVLGFRSGEIISATTGTVSGVEGVYAYLTWEKGSFKFTPGDPGQGAPLAQSVEHLLLEGCRLLDESQRGGGEMEAPL